MSLKKPSLTGLYYQIPLSVSYIHLEPTPNSLLTFASEIPIILLGSLSVVAGRRRKITVVVRLLNIPHII